jgi:hypothetical protein
MENVIHLDNVRTGRFERVRLGDRQGTREPDVYLPGLLLKGQSHLFYGASDTGKSWIAQYASRESIHDGKPVLYFDLENGPDVMEERMIDALRVSRDELDSFFLYYPFVDLTLDKESKSWFTSLLDSFSEPGLIVWDSLLGHLSQCDLDEDSSDDFEKWARLFLDRPRADGWTSLVLDHSGHAGTHARGSSRKSQSVQVVYKVEKKESFDRTTDGRQKLTREKDRLAYLPASVEVALGGTPFEFKPKYDGQEFLKNSENRALFLLYKYGPSGATHGEWKARCTTGENGMSESTFNRAVRDLKDNGYTKLEGKSYCLTKKGESKVS